MITVVNIIRLNRTCSLEEAKALFAKSVPMYVDMPGLIRKCYIHSEDGRTTGGVYLWRTREDAQRCHTEEWKTFVREKYSAEPELAYFDSPVVVDNLVGRVILD